MGKKCIPGVICIENMTLFFIFVILVVVIYLWYIHFVKNQNHHNDNRERKETGSVVIVSQPSVPALATISPRRDPFNDPYAPPLQSDGIYYPTGFSDPRGLPVNIKTRGLQTGYQQVGILTRTSGQSNDMILPLMGRRNTSGRDKWQYYTISNSGNLNTKLPISVNGKSCTSEHGCDDINNGDMVYVEGYNDTFRVTIYENDSFQYIPYL